MKNKLTLLALLLLTSLGAMSQEKMTVRLSSTYLESTPKLIDDDWVYSRQEITNGFNLKVQFKIPFGTKFHVVPSVLLGSMRAKFISECPNCNPNYNIIEESERYSISNFGIDFMGDLISYEKHKLYGMFGIYLQAYNLKFVEKEFFQDETLFRSQTTGLEPNSTPLYRVGMGYQKTVSPNFQYFFEAGYQDNSDFYGIQSTFFTFGIGFRGVEYYEEVEEENAE